MAPLEPWEKAIVDAEKFAATAHGEKTCIECHGGIQAADKATAHTDLIASPSVNPAKVCGECHAEEVRSYPGALHATQAGYWTTLDARSTPENHPALETMFGNHCASCHTTCGECHVAQPANVGGGLFSGHVFEKTPPMTRSCTACHGSRVGNEYLGKNEGVPGDVHFREGRMNCVACHAGADLHGAAQDTVKHRYSGAQDPACVDCHPTAAPGGDDNPMHQVHGQALSCQACHSVTYTSCDSCHVAVSKASGNPFFETAATYSTFLIGRNPRQDRERPYDYVPVRHVPVDPESFAYYGDNLLPNFEALPTWVYATPHNIQRETPQNASCDACHGNAAIFLTADKVKPEELAANQAVIIENPPAAVAEMLASLVLPESHAKIAVCNVCHLGDNDRAPRNPVSHAGRGDSTCLDCHKLP